MTEKIGHLIIVAGNSVLSDTSTPEMDLRSDTTWLLKEREKCHSVPVDILRHINIGVEIHKGDSSSLLIFSGGATRAQAPWYSTLTEAKSYFSVAEKLHKNKLYSVLQDIYSYNSGHNLLFGINKFWIHTKHRLPERITVVTRDIKQERFSIYLAAIEQHIRTRFEYSFVGVRDTDADYASQSYEYELNNQLPKLRENPMRDFEELMESRTPGPQGILEEEICTDLATLIHKCTKAATMQRAT